MNSKWTLFIFLIVVPAFVVHNSSLQITIKKKKCLGNLVTFDHSVIFFLTEPYLEACFRYEIKKKRHL